MGWTFLYDAPEKRHVIEEATREGEMLKCVRKSTVGNHLWTVWESKDNGKRYIVLFLLAKNRGNWGYKDITESMGPLYYDCPLSLLKEAPVANETWRDQVVEYHRNEKARRSSLKNLSIGKTVRLKEGFCPNELTVIEVNPLIGIANGRRYRLRNTHIVDVL